MEDLARFGRPPRSQFAFWRYAPRARVRSRVRQSNEHDVLSSQLKDPSRVAKQKGVNRFERQAEFAQVFEAALR